MTSFWLLLAPLALLPLLDAAYVAIGGRILASWLIAIGLMLGAAKMFQPQLPVTTAEPVRGQSAPAFGVPDDPRFEPHNPAVLRAPAD